MGWLVSDEEAKTLRHLADKTETAIKAVLGPMAVELSGWAGEAIGSKRDLWRLKNQLNMFEEARKILSDRNVKPDLAGVLPRQFVPLLEAIGNEDNDNIQKMWAGLIANAADPNRRQQVNRAFTHILASIDPLEAQILQWIEPILLKSDPNKVGEGIDADRICTDLGISGSDLKFSLHHLSSLGCFRVSANAEFLIGNSAPNDPWPSIVSDEVIFQPTELAVALIQACSRSV